jgi:acyl-CoA thioester hydrolase
VGPVAPETAIRHLREPLAGDEAEVTCVPVRGDCKAFRVQQTLRRTDGTVAAEGEAIGALVDRTSREPVPDPEQRLRGLASVPASVGL